MTDEPADQTDPIAVWKESPGFGRALTIGVTIGAIASFLAVGGGILLAGQGVAAAIGLGLFTAFWGGLGFGAMIAGVVWATRLEAAAHRRAGGPTS